MEKIMITADDGSQVALYVLEQTRLGGFNYILVTDVEEGDGEAFILKDISDEASLEAIYEPVEDEAELEAVATVFENLLEDIDLV